MRIASNTSTIRLLNAIQIEFGEKTCILSDSASYFTANAVQEFVKDTPIELCYLPQGSPELDSGRRGRNSIKHSATACSILWANFVTPRSTASIHQISLRAYGREYRPNQQEVRTLLVTVHNLLIGLFF
ncbi:hypothetical protein EIK79_14850 [Halocatena pleomorpha]|uniref:Tc1-like transposase DDE domain-containing protein n=1 Tax=Halocatena pleomorpha TaxID=1785090 RepID=A0A3P3R707_9EURY|nr:hypothetical protein EIK79_14850 [Halocatena pleomorpha]